MLRPSSCLWKGLGHGEKHSTNVDICPAGFTGESHQVWGTVVIPSKGREADTRWLVLLGQHQGETQQLVAKTLWKDWSKGRFRH